MNQQERNQQFIPEARAFFTALYGHADLREREALAAFLRRFAEHVARESFRLQDCEAEMRHAVISTVDNILPFEEN